MTFFQQFDGNGLTAVVVMAPTDLQKKNSKNVITEKIYGFINENLQNMGKKI